MNRRNFSWILLGNLLYAASQWGVLQTLAIWGTPVDIGLFALGLAIAAPIVIFGEKAVRILVATDVEHSETLANYVSFFLILSVSMTFVAFLPILATRPFESQLVILLVLLNKLLDGSSEVINGYFQQQELMSLVGQSKIAKSILSLFVTGSVLAATGSLILALSSTVVMRLALLFVVDRRNVSRVRTERSLQTAILLPDFSLTPTLRLLRLSFPLCVATLLISTSANVPRYLLAANEGEMALGIFSVLFYLTVPFTTVLGAMIDTTRPRFAKLFHLRKLHDLKRLALKLGGCVAGMGVMVCIATSIGGYKFLDVLYGNTYSKHADWLLLISVSTLVGGLATVPATILAAIRQFRLVIVDCAIALATSLISASILIPLYGTKGAIYSMTVTNAVHGVVSLVLLAYKCRALLDTSEVGDTVDADSDFASCRKAA